MTQTITTRPVPVEALTLTLTLPHTQIRVGPLTIDPLAQYLGRPLEEILKPVLSGPVTTHTRGDTSVSAYPLHLEDGQTLTLPLGKLGQLILGHDRGLILLTLPLVAVPLAQGALSRWVARGSTPGLDLSRGGFTWWLNLPKGETMALPLGPLGELGVGRGSP